MTNETKPVLLTEAEWHALLGLAYKHAEPTLRERGLIAPEVDPLEQLFASAFEGSDIGAIGGWHQFYAHFRKAYDAAGMELAKPELTREMVREAVDSIPLEDLEGAWRLRIGDKLHAALTEGQSK